MCNRVYSILCFVCFIFFSLSASEGGFPQSRNAKDVEKDISFLSEFLATVEAGKDPGIKIGYVCTAFFALSNPWVAGYQNVDSVRAVTETVLEKSPYTETRACAAEATGWFGNQKSATALLKALHDENDDVRLQAAGSLLQLGQGIDQALETIDRLAQKPNATINALLKLSKIEEDGRDFGDLWSEKCEIVIKNGSHSKSNEIRAGAAYYFARKNKQMESAFAVAFSVLQDLKDKDIRNYVSKYEGYSDADLKSTSPSNIPLNCEKFYSDNRACDSALEALRLMKNRHAASVLKKISEKNKEWWYVCKGLKAEPALQEISRDAAQ